MQAKLKITAFRGERERVRVRMCVCVCMFGGCMLPVLQLLSNSTGQLFFFLGGGGSPMPFLLNSLGALEYRGKKCVTYSKNARMSIDRLLTIPPARGV